jgi:anti-anti-sigma factor
VILDFAGVSRMDAGGLGILAAFAEAIVARGGCLRLARVARRVRRTIEVAGLAEVLPIGPGHGVDQ